MKKLPPLATPNPLTNQGENSKSSERLRLERRVGFHHFAFFRAYAEGLDLAKAADRYLETGPDLKKARTTLKWIRDELIAAAMRKNASQAARVLKIPPAKLITTQSPPTLDAAQPELLTLEAFQAERDPQGFWSEQELVELFEQEMAQRRETSGRPPEDRKAQRNARLRERLIEAVRWLESWVATNPKPEDPLLVWLDRGIGERLNRHGILTISDLVATINREGYRWHAGIPKFGQASADRVITWLQAAQVIPLTDRALLPYRANRAALAAGRSREFGIVPLEYLSIPPEHAHLMGATGCNRSHGRQLAATNDIEAVISWLESRRKGSHTRRSYTLHVERFLLWMIFERGKPLSSAVTEDCASYRDFLAALGDPKRQWTWKLNRTAWMAPKGYRRLDPRWKPFVDGLSMESQKLSITVLRIMFKWLNKKNYLEANPWEDITTVVEVRPRLKTDHALTDAQWDKVIQHCETLPPDERYWRLKLLLWLAYSTGLRLFEIKKASVADIRESDDGDGYELWVVGKRNKLRIIPLGARLMTILADYMDVRGHGRDFAMWPPEAPLVASLADHLQHAQTPGTMLSDTAIYNILTKHFKAVAAEIELEDMRAADRLRRASTHWLRHTCATHLVRGNIPMDVTQDLLGHESPATTALYVSPGKERKRKAVEQLLSKA